MYVYILKLDNGKYYVGRTSDMTKRLQEHVSGNGSIWTSMYPPISVEMVYEGDNPFEEDLRLIEVMARYGIENVRGGSFSDPELSASNIEVIERMIRGAQDRCFRCGEPGHWCISCPNVIDMHNPTPSQESKGINIILVIVIAVILFMIISSSVAAVVSII